MKLQFLLLSIGILLIQNACIPVNATFETAKTLKKDEIEINGNYTQNRYTDAPDEGNDNFGLRLGYGLTDKLDIKLRYKHITRFYGNSTANYAAIMGKYSLINDKLAVLLPIEGYFTDGFTFATSPTLIGTHTFNDNVDLSLSVKINYLENSEGRWWGRGLNIGAGFSSNLDKWAVRPEIGIQYLDEAFSYNIGLGIEYKFFGK